jgi:hypothetical protein
MVCDGEVQCESRYLLKNESGCMSTVFNRTTSYTCDSTLLQDVSPTPTQPAQRREERRQIPRYWIQLYENEGVG